MQKYETMFASTDEETERHASLASALRSFSIPDDEILNNLGLFMPRQALTRLLFVHDIYRRVIGVEGNIFEFGVRWGQNLALFETFRAIYEPFVYMRRIIGFDTFKGFPSLSAQDGSAHRKGDLAVGDDYQTRLRTLIAAHEANSPISHISRSEIVVGDVCKTLPDYLDRHPETIAALVYLDLDIYEPTKVVLERIQPHLVKGSVIVFDELNNPEYPGETMAMREVFGTRLALQRSPLSGWASFAIWE